MYTYPYGNSSYGKYTCRGEVWETDSKGNEHFKRIVYCSGVVKMGPEHMGKIFRQNPDLLPCKKVTVEISPI